MRSNAAPRQTLAATKAYELPHVVSAQLPERPDHNSTQAPGPCQTFGSAGLPLSEESHQPPSSRLSANHRRHTSNCSATAALAASLSALAGSALRCNHWLGEPISAYTSSSVNLRPLVNSSNSSSSER